MSETSTEITVGKLRCEYKTNPLGIDTEKPRLSWQLTSARRGAAQSAYQIRVQDGPNGLWDSGKVTSDQSIHVPYGGPALSSGQRCTWQVRVWDGLERSSMVGNGTAGPRRLDSTVDRPGLG